MRSILLGSAILVALAGPAAAQRMGGPGGPGGFGGRMAAGGPGRFGGGPRGPGRMRQRFDNANVTHDGHLTLDQARAGQMPMIARHFADIDTAHKGYITLDDLRAYRSRVMEERRAAQGEPDPVGPDPGPPMRGGGPPPGGPPPDDGGDPPQ